MVISNCSSLKIYLNVTNVLSTSLNVPTEIIPRTKTLMSIIGAKKTFTKYSNISRNSAETVIVLPKVGHC